MAKPSDSRSMRGRVERLGHDIETIRAQEAAADRRAADEVTDLAARHGELQRRLAELEAQGKAENHIDGALAADRQDSKTARQ